MISENSSHKAYRHNLKFNLCQLTPEAPVNLQRTFYHRLKIKDKAFIFFFRRYLQSKLRLLIPDSITSYIKSFKNSTFCPELISAIDKLNSCKDLFIAVWTENLMSSTHYRQFNWSVVLLLNNLLSKQYQKPRLQKYELSLSSRSRMFRLRN